MTDRAPIAIFGYRRPDSLARLLASLTRCPGFADSQVYVFLDGPRGDRDAADVARTRAVADGLVRPGIEVIASTANRGLRRSVHAGVSQVLARHDRVIVLEDDLEVAPCALDYFDRALIAYRDADQVKAVSGFAYDVPGLRDSTEAFFLPFAASWGWATWARAWEGFGIDGDAYAPLLRSRAFRHRFGAQGAIRANVMLDMQLRGLIDSWYILWNAFITAQGGLCLYPPRSVTKNAGHASAGATHSNWLNPFNHMLARHDANAPLLADAANLGFPPDIRTDFARLDAIVESWHCRTHRYSTDLGHLRRALTQWRRHRSAR